LAGCGVAGHGDVGADVDAGAATGFVAASRGFAAGAGGDAVVCNGTEAPAEAVRTGAAGDCFGLIVRSAVLAATCSFSRVDESASDLDPLNQVPIKPAIVVGLLVGASPCFGCGATRGIGTLATATGALSVAAGSGCAGA